MAESNLVLIPSDRKEQAEELGNIPARQIRCRKGHHAFALDDWIPGEEIPRGVAAMHASEGRYKLVEPCLNCSEVSRVTLTHPGGGIDGYLQSHLVYGPGWYRLPSYIPRGRRAMRDEAYRRGGRQLQALIGRAVTLLEDDDQPVIRAVQPVRFQGA